MLSRLETRMSVEPSSRKTGSGRLHLFAMVTLSFVVAGLQIGLPYLAHPAVPRNGLQRGRSDTDPQYRDEFWFYRKIPLLSEEVQFWSAAVCQDELLALISRQSPPRSERIARGEFHYTAPDVGPRTLMGVPTELIRCNLRSGKLTISPIPPGVEHVLSDGQKLWWLPKVPSQIPPFLWNGKPATLVSSPRDPALCQLMEFEQHLWRLTDRFALLPDCFDHEGTPLVQVRVANDRLRLHFPIRSGLRMYYRDSFEIGTEEDARKYRAQHSRFINQLSTDEFVEQGWRPVFDAELEQILRAPSGYWYEQDMPCAIVKRDTDRWVYLCEGDIPERRGRSLASPIRWDSESRRSWDHRLKMIASTDDHVDFLSYGGDDGRIHVIRFEAGRMRLLAQHCGPHVYWADLVNWVIIDGLRFFGLAVLLPMLALALITGVWQRWAPPGTVGFGHETVKLASLARRASAKLIDVALAVSFLGVAIFWHPDAIGWWNVMTERNEALLDHGSQFLAKPTGMFLLEAIKAFQTWLLELISAPVAGWLLISFLAIGAAQIIWQARTGKTVGKWLLGIKVVATTLRPCGIARSLLRELMIGFDGLMLLCWLPGVISILSTPSSQRFGDRLADTIVIREASR